ncbi:MAG: PEP-CTERM sorting domain-containing protein [Armatimonadetes bacterium]|nr:PEP-CTERM sorting domain-containing protein [Armatimonadota bacterium]MBS1728238.1 PEP-CTERM sorting domain-containing protein [Armatimonadota bacterium]
MSLVAGVVTAGFASAGTYTFEPSNGNLSNLDHYYAYSWGIDFNVPQGETITGATLTIKNIWDWTQENDILYVQMLDNPASGVKSFYDNQGGGNYFGGQGTAVGTWSDPVGGHSTNTNLTFDLGSLGLLNKLNQYAADGRFGFGFDPDCHYYNDGVKLTITTSSPVPEPASFATLGVGAFALLRRRKKNVR